MYRRKLMILNPLEADTGIYECEAQFNQPGGSSVIPKTARANLTVQGTASFDVLALIFHTSFNSSEGDIVNTLKVLVTITDALGHFSTE